jgi:deoxyribonuclease-4
MAILGAHVSIDGGYHKAVERARAVGCDCLQIFTKNGNQWRDRQVTAEESRRFAEALSEFRITRPIAHDSYLINLASPDKDLWKKSLDAFVAELRRAAMLGIPYVVTHPGAYTTGSEKRGLAAIVRALDRIHRQTQGIAAECLLETTAGQGTTLGWRFDQLATILDGVKEPNRLGVCFDTCHVFAAGYPMGTQSQYETTMARFDEVVGIERIKAIHLNDSRRPLGSRVDRHAHVGEGEMGLAPFRHLLADDRFREVPMYLETPKEKKGNLDWDVVNLKRLRELS